MHLDCLLYGTGASTMFVSMSELIDALAGTLSIWNARDASELSLPCSWTDHSHTDMAMTTVTVVQWHAASIYTQVYGCLHMHSNTHSLVLSERHCHVVKAVIFITKARSC